MSRADGMPQLRTTKRPQAASPASAAPTRPPYQKYELVVAPSHIDGQGVFAVEPIAAGRKIGEIRGEAISVDEARIRATRSERIMIVELSERKAIDFSRSADPMRYTNHSCAPNARRASAAGAWSSTPWVGRSRRARRSRWTTARRTTRGNSSAGAARRAASAASDIGQSVHGFAD